MSNTYDVAIVGYGPVGTTLALLLQKFGLSTVIIDRDTQLCRFPRAAMFDDEVIRILQAVGLGDLSKEMEPPTSYTFFDKDWRKFLQRPFPQGMGDQGWPWYNMFFQPGVETAMREALLSRPQPPEILVGHEVESISDNGDSVDLAAWHIETGAPVPIRARFVVGCDGGRSLVRKTIGATFTELSPSHEWYIVDVKLTADADPGWDQWEYCHPDRIVTMIPLCGRYRRFEFGVLPDDDREQLSSWASTWELLEPWLKPNEAEILRKDIYRFHSLVSNRWRNGNLLIAGDAAHLMTPKLGQGLCTGMRDVLNLGWKLARVVRGHADPALLDTYQAEREPAGREFVEISAYLANQIIGHANTDADEPVVEVEEIVLQRQCISNQEERTNDPLVGTLSPQPRFADGSLMDDSVGYRFTLLVEPVAAVGLDAEILRGLTLLDVEVVSASSPEMAAYLAASQRAAILIRPDRYIAGSARDPEGISQMVQDAVAKFSGVVPAS